MTCGLKTPGDAVDLRGRIFGAFEEAERADESAARDEWLTFVVIGGGPTGVEISGQLAVLSRHTMKRDFRRIDPRAARVILLDAGERLVAAFSEPTSATAAKELGDLGVTVREHARVTDIDARGVMVTTGDKVERIATRTVVWAAGVRAAGIADVLARGTGTGAGTDRAGHIEVNPELTRARTPEISVIGDAPRLAGDGRQAASRPRHRGHPAGATRRRRDPRRPIRRLQALRVPRQGRARRGRPRQGGVRGQGSPDLGLARLPDVRGRAPVQPRRCRRPALDRDLQLDRVHLRRPREPGHRRRARARGAPGPRRSAGGGAYLDRHERLMLEGMSPWPTS